MYKLLSVNADSKTVKGVKYGYLTGILYLVPSSVLCPCCSEGCRKACLFSAGRGRMKCTQGARMRRTGLYMNQLETFKRWLREDIKRLCAEAQRKRLKPCVRLNGTSDIDVQEVFGDILDEFSSAHFYDYTKVWNRKSYKSNYYLVYSRSETTTEKAIDKKIEEGYNVAVVFDEVPEVWRGHTVVPGDDSDLRFLDPQGCIIGLKSKGKARKDDTGFVVRVGGTST